MGNINKKTLIDTAIKGLALFFIFVVSVFIFLGKKSNDGYYVFRFYAEHYDECCLYTFIFSYIEILSFFYIRNKNINNWATHIISILYSFVITFVVYLNMEQNTEYYDGGHYNLKFSAFIWLIITIEIMFFILAYKENDLRKKLPNKQIFKFKKKHNGNGKSDKNNLNSNENTTRMLNIEQNDVTKNTKKQRMFSHPFSFKGRIRRLEYDISFFIFTLYSIFFSGLEPIVWLYSIVFSIPKSIGWVIFSIPALWFIAAQGAKRCHDAGNSGWCQLIPFWTVFLLFEEGDAETNKYGPNPKEKIKIQKNE